MVARGGAVGGGQSACQELDVPLGHLAFDDMRVRSAWAHRAEPQEDASDGPTPGGAGGVSILRGKGVPLGDGMTSDTQCCDEGDSVGMLVCIGGAPSHIRVRMA